MSNTDICVAGSKCKHANVKADVSQMILDSQLRPIVKLTEFEGSCHGWFGRRSCPSAVVRLQKYAVLRVPVEVLDFEVLVRALHPGDGLEGVGVRAVQHFVSHVVAVDAVQLVRMALNKHKCAHN